jgi:two-component system OmpR family sensor kinase
LAFLIARWIARPLTKMAGAAGALAEGKDEQEVSPGGPTEVRELAAAFNEMVRRVQASQQAQRDFVANVSHELKTPLTSIRGFAQALVEGAVVGEEGRQRAARVIREEAERLHRLVDDLLELARFDAGQVGLKREPTDMRSLLERAMDRIRPLATEGGIRLELEVEQLPTVISDGDRLAQVFTNLLDNAVAHTPAGGLVSVKATGSGGWIRVEIADTGEGIEPARLPRLFERFYQGDEARAGGVGLGLAISDEIVRAHGGQISAESEVGVGSRFIVQIPVAMPSDSTVSARRL